MWSFANVLKPIGWFVAGLGFPLFLVSVFISFRFLHRLHMSILKALGSHRISIPFASKNPHVANDKMKVPLLMI